MLDDKTLYPVDFRERVVEILKAAGTIAGDEVFDWRTDRFWSDATPAFNVLTPDENGQNEDRGGAPSFRTELTIVVELVVAQNENAGRQLDLGVRQAKAALFTNAEFTRLFSKIDSVVVSSSITNDTEKRTISASISIGVQYDQTFDPLVPDDLAVLFADWDPDHEAAGRPPLVDRVDLPTEGT